MMRSLWATTVLCLLAVGPGTRGEGDDVEKTQAETEALVRADLAARLKVGADELRVDEAKSRTWADKSLGCGERKGLEEPTPVPGYEFTLSYSDKKVTYRTDRHGRLVRCAKPGKPLGPIR